MKFQFILITIATLAFATASLEVSDVEEGVIAPVESNTNIVADNDASINSKPELDTANAITSKDNSSASADNVPDNLTDVTEEGDNVNSTTPSGDNGDNANAINDIANTNAVSNSYSEGKTDEADVNKTEDTVSNVDAIPADTGDAGEVSDDYEEGKNKIKANDINGIGDGNSTKVKDTKVDANAVGENGDNAVEESDDDNNNSTDTTVAAGLAGAAAISSAGLFLWVKRSKHLEAEFNTSATIV